MRKFMRPAGGGRQTCLELADNMKAKRILIWICLMCAVVLQTATSRAQTLTTLISFNGTNGAYPQAALTLGNDGNFYGTTSSGGSNSNGGGTVFQITTNGVLTTLVSFNGTNGESPFAGLTLGNDGNFYGTTLGLQGIGGNVFQVTTNGVLTSLVSFNGNNGAYPYAGLTLGNDGNFYGTTYGGSINNGTVFMVTTIGVLTTLVSFANTNGASPYAGLTLGNDGNFYGTTYNGGSFHYGTIFQVTTNGVLTTLVSFANTNGANPKAALTLGNDSNFYGTTYHGGSSGEGTVFRVTTNGILTTLVSFNETNGMYPSAALTLGKDGNFYGTTYGGGSYYGTIFQITTNGALTTLISFNGSNGAEPTAPLAVGNDGSLFGTLGNNSIGEGCIYHLSLAPMIIVQPLSQTNYAGSTVTFAFSVTPIFSENYQWQKNGTNLVNGGNISGANTNALTITNISNSDAASYSVIVSNFYGTVTSSNATLTVLGPPVITVQPTNMLVLPGANVAFGISFIGSVPFFPYQWKFNGSNILNATNVSYSISSVGTNNAGNYSIVITNPAGSVISSNAALTVVLSPKSQTNYASSTATFTGTAFSPESLNYQWQKNGTNLVNGGNLSGATNSTLTIANVSDADAAIYNLVVSDATGSVTTSNATLTVNDLPIIFTQPLSQSIGVGSNVTFTAVAYGATPLVFQWYFNNSPVGSPTSGTNVSSYTLTNVQTNKSGNYSVQVFNGYDSATSSNAVLKVLVYAPSITTQPTNQTVLLGRSAAFTVSANGSLPFQYQWRFNNTNILGATNAAYIISSVVATNTGNYSVTITNSAGGVTSSNALLNVIVPPVVSFQFLAGYPQLNLNGMLSSNFIVQFSTNLAGTNWINLRSVSNLSANPYQFLDPAGSGQPARFYRALMQ